MLQTDDLIPVGKAGKTHGYRGEVTVFFNDIEFDEDGVRYFIVSIDGLYTPYFIESIRYTGSGTAYIRFEGIEDDVRAKEILIGKTLYVERVHAHLDNTGNRLTEGEETEEEDALYRFIHYTIMDRSAGNVGIIKDLDLQTANPLFIVETLEGKRILIPIAEEFIKEIDDEHRLLHTILPEGLITL